MSPRVLWLTAVVLVLAGCRKSPRPETDSGVPLGDGNVTSLSKAANDPGFVSPFDATPSPDGKSVYFTALQGTDPAVLTIQAGSTAAATVLFSGLPLIAPFGIATDSAGANLFIADANGTGIATDDTGALFILPVTGGTPSPLATTVGYAPRGVAVLPAASGDVLYFTGVDKANGLAGVFIVPTAGGSVTVVAEGAPFVDPSGIAVNAAGDTFIVDTVSTTRGMASVIEVSGGTATVVLSDILAGYPGGIALSQDESALLISAVDPLTRTDEVIRVVLATQTTTVMSSGINTFHESAGLHRAHGAEVYAWADSEANSGGTVYVLK